jgi:hypothetical protein
MLALGCVRIGLFRCVPPQVTKRYVTNGNDSWGNGFGERRDFRRVDTPSSGMINKPLFVEASVADGSRLETSTY